MRNEDKVIGATEWLQDIFGVVSEHVEEWNSTQRVIGNITAYVRAMVASKLQLLEKGKLQPLDRETYRAAVGTMVEMLVGKDADARAIKTARQNVTSGSRWNFGVFSPSDKRRAQVGKAKAAKNVKAKVAAKGTKNAAMTAIANAVSSALKRGVTHLQIVDTLNGLGSIVKK